ncbi:S49 family peptidase, partial [Candidatus Woesearchaeota archaeon]|nr:S49 family peptidase [Candidatus Woesearchaeota archaeon]
MAKTKVKETSLGTKILIIVVLLFVLFLFSSCAALFVAIGDLGNFEYAEGNVAVIPIKGVIVTESDTFGGGFAVSDDIISSLEDARDDKKIKAVILEIDSPGGRPVPSDEIGRAVRSVRAQNKTVVAWVRDVGASGAYWIASSADHIVANRMSLTGSIGVTGSYFGLEEFIDDWNVTYRRFVSGEMKDVGTPFREMTRNEEKFVQKKINLIHIYFVDEVANNRNLSVDYVTEL